MRRRWSRSPPRRWMATPSIPISLWSNSPPLSFEWAWLAWWSTRCFSMDAFPAEKDRERIGAPEETEASALEGVWSWECECEWPPWEWECSGRDRVRSAWFERVSSWRYRERRECWVCWGPDRRHRPEWGTGFESTEVSRWNSLRWGPTVDLWLLFTWTQ
jgi:hypothetical protein